MHEPVRSTAVKSKKVRCRAETACPRARPIRSLEPAFAIRPLPGAGECGRSPALPVVPSFPVQSVLNISDSQDAVRDEQGRRRNVSGTGRPDVPRRRSCRTTAKVRVMASPLRASQQASTSSICSGRAWICWMSRSVKMVVHENNKINDLQGKRRFDLSPGFPSAT